eukprot:3614825-Rhodomonas_salina.1
MVLVAASGMRGSAGRLWGKTSAQVLEILETADGLARALVVARAWRSAIPSPNKLKGWLLLIISSVAVLLPKLQGWGCMRRRCLVTTS